MIDPVRVRRLSALRVARGSGPPRSLAGAHTHDFEGIRRRSPRRARLPGLFCVGVDEIRYWRPPDLTTVAHNTTDAIA